MLKLCTNYRIEIDGKQTGLAIWQRRTETLLYVYKTRDVIDLPHKQYSLSRFISDGLPPPGLDQLEEDIKKIIYDRSIEIQNIYLNNGWLPMQTEPKNKRILLKYDIDFEFVYVCGWWDIGEGYCLNKTDKPIPFWSNESDV